MRPDASNRQADRPPVPPPNVVVRSTVGATLITTTRHSSHFEVSVFVHGRLTVVHQRYSLADAVDTHGAEAERAGVR
jgi:hypothetical protein